MKKGKIIGLIVVILIVLVPAVYLGMLGYIPGLSSILGAKKPLDLGIKYTKEDFDAAHGRSGVNYEELKDAKGAESSISFSGSHDVNTSWTSEEMTALLNDRPWKYWPISKVQLRINSDNTVEMSGIINSVKLKGYAQAIGVSAAVADRTNLLPGEAAFYLKGSASLSDNQVSSFDITGAKLGAVSISPSLLLSANNSLTQVAYAEDLKSELSKYSGKKGYIVDFINSKLSWVQGFFAKRAEFKNAKLEFDGKLPDKEASAR